MFNEMKEIKEEIYGPSGSDCSSNIEENETKKTRRFVDLMKTKTITFF